MCRHLAYLGDPIPLSRLLFEPPHSLEHQSWAPRNMWHGGIVNADGFGIGWYAGDTAVRLRRDVPLWTDADLRVLSSATSSGAILAAVRSATIGMPITDSAAAPFTDGQWLFSLNGRISGWPGSVTELAAELPATDLLTLDSPTDAAFAWAMLRHRLCNGRTGAEAITDIISRITAVAPTSLLNLLLTDGSTMVATTWGHSLSTRRTETGITIASEPLDDDPLWQDVPDRRLVVATAEKISISELPGETDPP